MKTSKFAFTKAVNWTQFKEFNGIQSDFIVDKIIDILNIEHTNSYPVILFPKSFKDLLHKKFINGKKQQNDGIYFEDLLYFTIPDSRRGYTALPPHEKELYSYNQKPNPKKPQKREIPSTYTTTRTKPSTGCYGCLSGITGLILVPLFLFKIESYIPSYFHDTVSIIVMIISCIFIIIFDLTREDDSFFEDEDIERKYSFFQKRRLRIKRDKQYEKELKIYHQSLAALPEEILKYNRIRKFQSDEIEAKRNTICYNITRRALCKSTKFIQIFEGPQKGFSEDALFYILMKHIPKQTFIDGKVGNFYPDIIVKTSNDICIDIEIDEPYEYKDRKEIHYIGCGDKERDRFFCDNNWFVVRFSEYQIINHATKCVDIILLLKELIEFGDCKSDLLETKVSDISMSFWTKEEARVMAIEKFRDNRQRSIGD